MMQGEAIWKLSNKMPCFSAIKYLTRGTKCLQSDVPTKLQISHSYKLKEVSKYNMTQEQTNERYSFLVPCGKNKYLFSAERNNSMYGITDLVLCNLRARPMGQLQELLSCLNSAMMFHVSKDTGIIKSMMSFPSMEQMCVHLSISKINNSGQPKGELKIHAPVCGLSDKQAEKRNIYTTETIQDKKIEFCPPKKSRGGENNQTCDCEQTTAKTGAKGDGRKECLTPKNQNRTYCAKCEEKTDLSSSQKSQMKASTPLQEAHCGKDNNKKDCLIPKIQEVQNFCESKNDLLSNQNSQMKASASAAAAAHSAKADSKKECLTAKPQATQTFCAKDESKNDPFSTSKTQVKAPAHSSQSKSSVAYSTKSESKSKASAAPVVNCSSESSASPKAQMKAAGCANAPGSKGPDQNKPPKKEESKKGECGSKSKAGAQETKGSDKKPEVKKDPCAPKPPVKEPKVCEPKQPDEKPCPPKKEEKKRVGCEPPVEAKKCPTPPTPDKKLKGNIPYPCPRMSSAKKQDKGVPIWQCALISGIILFIAICICIWSMSKKEEPELDAKGRPIKKK